ncbi:hypothetical protein ACIRQQ_15670 [Streptomyces fuscichromogenes]|uniref:hypothetical protein n=1 Tax=Streptomyces fuscichromogenes TaxID=1324013 RepID=UPI003826C2A1
MGVPGERERIGYRAPLAVRCFDAAGAPFARDGLSAVAWPENDPATTVRATLSPVSDLLGFGSVPGRRAYQRARSTDGEPLNWPAPAAPEPFVVRVTDRARRYLPTTVLAEVPVATPVAVPLYPAPGRQAPTGWAVVRGELHGAPDGAPLGWGVVEVSTDAGLHSTVSDADGRFQLCLPYPEALPELPGASATGVAPGSADPVSGSADPAPVGLAALTWPVTVAVRCRPGALRRPPDSAAQDPPYLDSILGQPPALIDRGGDGPQPTVTETLTFGTALVLPLTVVPS